MNTRETWDIGGYGIWIEFDNVTGELDSCGVCEPNDLPAWVQTAIEDALWNEAPDYVDKHFDEESATEGDRRFHAMQDAGL